MYRKGCFSGKAALTLAIRKNLHIKNRKRASALLRFNLCYLYKEIIT